MLFASTAGDELETTLGPSVGHDREEERCGWGVICYVARTYASWRRTVQKTMYGSAVRRRSQGRNRTRRR